MSHPLDGVFPFGRPSTERPPRRPRSVTNAFVLGVYPSALHVRWSREGKTVQALAVDVEPTVFWDGADAVERVAAWKEAIGFRPEWGAVASAGNGTSGDRLNTQILDPLGVDEADVWFSDLVPWFFVKKRSGASGPRQQLEAIQEDYAPFAAREGLPEAKLPERLPIAKLVSYAVAERREHIRRELLASETRVLITLGEEPRSVVERIADRVHGRVTKPLTTSMTEYESAGALVIEGRKIEWWALKHPGQRKPEWMALHQRWIDKRSA
jgi:uracil-DNA glycosylase